MINALVSGIPTGAIYALIALGLAVIYRSGGVLNLALPSVAATALYIAATTLHWSGEGAVVLMLVATALGLLLSAGSYLLIISPVADKSPINGTMATLALNIALSAVALAAWGPNVYPIPAINVGATLHLGQIRLGEASIGAIVVTAIAVLLLTLLFRRTRMGLSIRAVGRGPLTAATMGIRVRSVRTAAWGIAGALTAVGAVLSSGNTGLAPGTITNLLVASFSGLVIGGFDSLVGVTFGCVIVGMMDAVLANAVSPWVQDVATFVVVLVLLVLRPNGLIGRHAPTLQEPVVPARHSAWSFTDRLVALSKQAANRRLGRWVAVGGIALLLVGVEVVAARSQAGMVLALQATAAEALMVMAMYVVMGLSGQLALGLGAFGAFGGYGIGYLSGHVSALGDLALAVPVAAVVGLAAGFLLGLPCARLKGIYLGTLTVIFAAAVEEYANHAGWLGGAYGVVMPIPKAFGIDLTGQSGLLTFELVIVVVGLVLVSLIRTSRLGRALIMLRDAQPAAQAFGVQAARFRVIGFMIGGALSAVGGLLLAISVGATTPDMFDVNFSLDLQAGFVTGGTTSIGGGLLGSGLFGVVPQLVPSSTYLPGLILGGVTIVVLLIMPSGLGSVIRAGSDLAVGGLRRHRADPDAGTPAETELSELSNV